MIYCLLCCTCAGLLWLEEEADASQARRYTTESLRGRVVWMHEAVEQQLGLDSVPEAKDRILALHTTDGQLLPLLEDMRARAFRLDERLRQCDLELLVRRHDKMPLLQVLRVFEITADDRKLELVYWCDICAITLFEQKPCDCCQGPVELQRRPVE